MAVRSQSGQSNPRIHRVVWDPQRFYMSMGWKTLIAFALVVFLPVFGLIQITGHTLRSAMENDAIHSLEANLRGAWRVYHERLNGVKAALMQSAATPSVQQDFVHHDNAKLRALLERNATLMPYADVWLALDANKRVIARRHGETGQQIYLNDLLQRAYTLDENVTSTEILPNALFMQENPLKYAKLDRQVLVQAAVVPVQAGGKVVGALVGLILMNDAQWLPNAIHDYLSIDAALFASVIQESRVVTTSDRPKNIWATGLLAPPQLNDSIRRDDIYRGKLMINGIPSFVIAEPITNLRGKPVGALSIGIKSDKIEAIIRHNTRTIYAFIGLGILLSIFIAYLAYRDTMTPLRALTQAMNDLAQGDLQTRTDLRTKDEFEGVGQDFNRMADAVQEHQERVESFNSLTSLLITSLKPKELLEKVLTKVVELTSSQAGLIYLAEPDEEALFPYVGYAIDLHAMDRLKFGQGLPGQVAVQQRLIHARNVPSDCKVSVNFGIADTLPKEVASIPIVYRDSTLGVMLLATLNGFRPSEMALLEYIANQIAVVLENALTHEKVERLSVTDGLTGIFNRRHLTERLESEFAKAQRYETQLSVLIIDIDHFKQINDTFGHQVGDNALLGVVGALKRRLRTTDLLGRYGGEEFVVMLPNTDRHDAFAVAQALRKEVEATKVAALGERRITVSIGVASYPAADVGDVDALLRNADEALYRAKESGRNRVVSSYESAVTAEPLPDSAP